jgi:hypothetical protein
MVRKWVVKYQQGGYGRLPAATPAMLPVVVKRSPVARRSRQPVTSLPVIEIELRRGIVRLHGADARLLQALIETLSA